MFAIKARLVHKNTNILEEQNVCFTEQKLSVFISALIQMRQGNPIPFPCCYGTWDRETHQN